MVETKPPWEPPLSSWSYPGQGSVSAIPNADPDLTPFQRIPNQPIRKPVPSRHDLQRENQPDLPNENLFIPRGWGGEGTYPIPGGGDVTLPIPPYDAHIPEPGDEAQLISDTSLAYPWDQIHDTIKTYPILGKYLKNFSFNYTPRGPGSHLETFPPGETGTSDYPRPKALPNDTYGLDIYDTKITPQLIMGDAMIHGLRQLDPKVNDLYTRFSNSILQDPHSYADLVRDYQWAKVNEGEKRDFETWANLSRIPELFGTPLYDTPVSVRGYSRRRFNREQQQIFHDTMQYIKGQ